jgi:23S rRNA-/tRNA-specific pseudouridylate synthase
LTTIKATDHSRLDEIALGNVSVAAARKALSAVSRRMEVETAAKVYCALAGLSSHLIRSSRDDISLARWAGGLRAPARAQRRGGGADAATRVSVLADILSRSITALPCKLAP